jgi:hypothetical protein
MVEFDQKYFAFMILPFKGLYGNPLIKVGKTYTAAQWQEWPGLYFVKFANKHIYGTLR